jgi:alkylated DNA repair dioxygenase AlkB
MSESCEESIRDKKIYSHRFCDAIPVKRIIKAINNGYMFNADFWKKNVLLLDDSSSFFNKHANGENICVKNDDVYDRGFLKVSIDDLNKDKFITRKFEFEITNVTDIKKTINEINDQHENFNNECYNITNNCYKNNTDPYLNIFELTKILSFDSKQLDLLCVYTKLIVLMNSLANTEYLQFCRLMFLGNPEKETLLNEKNKREKYNKKTEIEISHKPKYIKQITTRLDSGSDSDSDLDSDSGSGSENYSNCNNRSDIHSDYDPSELSFHGGSDFSELSLSRRKTICPEQNKSRIVQLNESGSSYLMIDYLPEKLQDVLFDDMWKLHPTKKHKIIMYEKEVEVNRYSKSYLNTPTDLSHTTSKSYMYSGFDVSENNDELPEEFCPFYEYMTAQDSRFNQVIANWYEDDNDYIAQHSDCQKEMICNAKISIISFYKEINDSRTLIMKPKKNKNDSIADRFEIIMPHGSIVTMCGDTQNNYTHGIDKEDESFQRLSLSFRQMEN